MYIMTNYDGACTYDPDGSYCYTHSVREDEHNRELTYVERQIDSISFAVRELLEFARLEVAPDKVEITTSGNGDWKVCLYTHGRLYRYATYVPFDGDNVTDGS